MAACAHFGGGDRTWSTDRSTRCGSHDSDPNSEEASGPGRFRSRHANVARPPHRKEGRNEVVGRPH